MDRSVVLRVMTAGALIVCLCRCGGAPPSAGASDAHPIPVASSAHVEAFATPDLSVTRPSRSARPRVPWTPSLKWSYTTPENIYYSSPAIATDGTVYVANGMSGVGGTGLYAFTPDGALKWTYINGSHYYMFTPVIAPDGTIYVQDALSSVYAVTPDGSLKWKHSFSTMIEVGQTAPAVAPSGVIYVGADTLYALNPDGTERWKAYVSGGIHEIYAISYVRSSPAVAADGTIYIAVNGSFADMRTGNVMGNAMLMALNPDTGTAQWKYVFPGSNAVFSSPAIAADGTIYLGSESSGDINTVYAINPNGTLRWRYDLTGGRTIRSSPTIAPDGTVYIGAKASTTGSGAPGELLALNPNGTLKWEYPITTQGADVYCSPTVAADGLIYFGAESGYLYALYPDGTLAWQYSTNNGINWTSPAIAGDGTLYIGNNNGTLFAIRTGSFGLADSPWPKFHGNVANSGLQSTKPPQTNEPALYRPTRPGR